MQPVHPLTAAREARNLSQLQLAQEVRLGAQTIWRAEHNFPINADSRRRLCRYFKQSAGALGLVNAEAKRRELKQARQLPAITGSAPAQDCPNDESMPVSIASPARPAAPLPLSPAYGSIILPSPRVQAIDLLTAPGDAALEQQAGAWLTLGTAYVGQLFDAGWSVEAILESLRVVLHGVQGMSNATRRQLLQIGAASTFGNATFPIGEHISVEEQAQLCRGLGESIGTAWKLFFSIGNAQFFTIGQTQLAILQQVHALLPPLARSSLFTGVYNLIGIAQHFQQHYEESLRSHRSAYIAALSTGDPWHVVQSLISQASDYQALGRYNDTIQVLEESLRVIGNSTDESLLRSRAHLLGCWADNAMSMGDFSTAQEKLDAAATYLDRFSPNEEFDRASWLQLSGKYALMVGDNATAIRHLEQALTEIPQTWLLRYIIALVPLSVAYALEGMHDASLTAAEQALPLLNALNSPMLNRFFVNCVEYGLLDILTPDSPILGFVAATRKM